MSDRFTSCDIHMTCRSMKRLDMALLDSDEEEFGVRRSTTNEQLFEDVSDFKGKDRREKKLKSEERKGSLKPWGKPKDGTQEKTPKKGKHNRTKSGSRTPPDSPKPGRSSDSSSRRSSKPVTGQLIHASPNVKGHRKRYSQLEGWDESSSDEDQEEGYLLSNKPALEEHRHQQQPLADLGVPDTSASVVKTTAHNVSFHDPPTAIFPAVPSPTSPVSKTSPQVPSFFDPTPPPPSLRDDPWKSAPPSSGPMLFPEPVAPDSSSGSTEQQQRGSEDRRTLPTNIPLFVSAGQGERKVQIHSPIRQPPPIDSSFFASPKPSVQQQPPAMVNPWATIETPPAADWSISEDLKEKCSKQFASLKPTSGLLQGDKAREFFVQSKLPNQELSQIWRLADRDKDNALSVREFCVAMKLVLMRRKGHDIPSSLPEELQLNEDSFSDSFWLKSSQSPQLQESGGDVIGGSPRSPQSDEDAVLVDIADNTGLLVDIGDEGGSPTPRVARIISLEDEEWPGDHDEDSALVKGGSSPPDQGGGGSGEGKKESSKPVRPAPPKPAARRSKSVREGKPTPPVRPDRKATATELSPPTSPPSGESETAPMIIISSQRARTTQRATSPPPTSKKSYTSLTTSESPNGSHDKSHDSKSAENEKDGESGKFKWRGFKGQTKGGQSPILEGKEKGHSRSTSLDLNKMLLGGENNTEVLEDMPSATPPKPPPKPHLPPRDEQPTTTTAPTTEDGDMPPVPRPRVRAASTGSMTAPVEALLTAAGASTAGEDDHHHVLDTSADALLLSEHRNRHPPPIKNKPSRKAPRRPPPPKNPSFEGGSKDKKEVQAKIRSLKENNLLLSEVNTSLEEKLFQLIEERVKLSRELEQTEQQYQ